MNEKGINTIALKKINKGKVYQYIYRNKTAAKQQIVQDLEMGLSTVSQNLNVLEEEGLIERRGCFESTGGRKAQIIQIVSDAKISIGVGILKDMFHVAAVNLYGESICMETFPLAYEDTSSYYTEVCKKIEDFLAQHQYPAEKILGISIATQGIISPDGSSVTYGTIMGNLTMRLEDFSSRLPYPCHLEHDSKAAAYLELWNHADLDSAVVFLLNRNLGGAVITNRTVHQGLSMHSGTLEHMCINPDGPICYCGSRGCLETYCSAHTLEAAVNMPLKEFFPLLRTGENRMLTQLWTDYLEHLAFAIRNLNLVIDSPVILSGYLAPWLTSEDLDYLQARIHASMPFPFARERLLVGTHGQYTPAIGAAIFYIEQFLKGIS